MLKVGLTGGIGSGKTTVTDLFASYGAAIIDADKIAHQLIVPKQLALAKIQAQFGDRFINNDGSLDRTQLKQLIFSSADDKKKLENILHPLIYAEILNQVKKLNTSYVILSLPLLMETGGEQFVDRILVIDCSVATQIQRVQTRDQLPEAMIQAIIVSQVQRKQRLKAADDVIDNSGKTMLLAEQVKKLHNLYLLLNQT